jgi:hypothetical protein
VRDTFANAWPAIQKNTKAKQHAASGLIKRRNPGLTSPQKSY